METKYDITKYTKEKHWSLISGRVHYTGHQHFNSPYESYDSCGNCDGARCNFCKRVEEPDVFECGIRVDELYDMLIKAGFSAEAASDITYSEHSWPYLYNKFGFKFPTEDDLKEHNPELYKKLSTIDQETIDFVKENIDKVDVYGDLFTIARKKYGLRPYDTDSHIMKQLELYYYKVYKKEQDEKSKKEKKENDK